MARKVSVVLVDDLDGSPAEEAVHFGVNGQFYEIDPRHGVPGQRARTIPGPGTQCPTPRDPLLGTATRNVGPCPRSRPYPRDRGLPPRATGMVASVALTALSRVIRPGGERWQ
jgi:hypothetical protein